MTSMTNPSKAVFLINTSVRAVMCAYETGEAAKRTMFKTLDLDIDVGDIVIVPSNTRHCFTTTKVVEVDVDVDYTSPEQINWIVSKVDMHTYEAVLDKEKAALKAIRSAEVKRERDKLREALLSDLGGTQNAAIALLAEATEFPDVPAMEPPPRFSK